MISGKGIYIWQLKRCEGGDMAKVVDRLKWAGMTHVLPKIADGVHSDVNGNWTYLPALVDLCHKAGIKVFAWQYIYGGNPVQEAIRAVVELRRLPFDGFVINAEHQFRDLANNKTAAKEYCERIRQDFPNLPLGLSSYRYPHYHARFPFTEFLTYCNFNMPQVYWMQANGTVPAQLENTIKAYEPYPQRPMIPTGAAFGEHGWTAVPADQAIFINEAKRHGLTGCNWWEYYEAFHRFPELGKAIAENNTDWSDNMTDPEHSPLERLYWPCDEKWKVTQYFGERPNVYTISRGHNGLDFGIPVGNPIYAAEAGLVEVAMEQTTGYGRHVRLRHSHGLTIYGHLSRIDVSVGQAVHAKQRIGLSGGATSDPYAGMSTGPHLHFEYRWDVTAPQVPGGYAYNAVDVLPLLISHTTEKPIMRARVIAGALNVRTGVGTSYTALYHYLKGTTVDVFEEKDNWLRIGIGRWFSGLPAYVERLPAPVDPDPEPPDPTDPEPVHDLAWLVRIHTTDKEEHP
jgi:murein DD-endopeptidase MepM/ murein hydrolase activator NlpD